MGKKFFPTETPDPSCFFLWHVVGGDTFSPLAPISRPVKKKKWPCHPPFLAVGEYDTKICIIRIDGASGICDGENFRRLVSTKRQKHEKQVRPSLEAYSNWKLQ